MEERRKTKLASIPYAHAHVNIGHFISTKSNHRVTTCRIITLVPHAPHCCCCYWWWQGMMRSLYFFTFCHSDKSRAKAVIDREIDRNGTRLGDEFIVIASICCLPFEKWWNENVVVGDDGQTFTHCLRAALKKLIPFWSIGPCAVHGRDIRMLRSFFHYFT